jgi:hypothetical protein
LGWKVVGIGFFVMTAPGSPVMTVILSLAIASADEGSADLGQLGSGSGRGGGTEARRVTSWR